MGIIGVGWKKVKEIKSVIYTNLFKTLIDLEVLSCPYLRTKIVFRIT